MELADKPVSRSLLGTVLSQAVPLSRFKRQDHSCILLFGKVKFYLHTSLYIVLSKTESGSERCGWPVNSKARKSDRFVLVVLRSCKEDTFREAQYCIRKVPAGSSEIRIYDTSTDLFGFDELAEHVAGFANIENHHHEEAKKMEEAKPMLGIFKAGNGYEYRFLYRGKVRSGYGHTEVEAQANAEKRRAELKARDEPPKPKEEPANEFAIYFPPDGAPPTFEKRGKLKAGDIMRALAIITREASYDFYESQILEVVQKALKGEAKLWM